MHARMRACAHVLTAPRTCLPEDFAAAGALKQEIEALEKTNPEKASDSSGGSADGGGAAEPKSTKESGEDEAARMLRER